MKGRLKISMSNLMYKILRQRNKVVEHRVNLINFGNYKLKPTIATLPLGMVREYTPEYIRTICESLNPEFISKYCLRIIGGKVINKYLFVRAGNFRSQGSTKYMQLDLDTFETVNIWEANEFPETIEIGEYNA